MIITVGGIKGGSGKSTVATNLVVLRSLEGRDVLLVDADTQTTSSDFSLQGPEPEFASWAAICDGMKWPPAGSSLLTSRFGASSRHFSLLQKRILSMKRHRDEHDLGERWSWTHDEFDLLRNRTDSGPITT